MKYMKYGTMYGKLVEKYKWGVLSNGEIRLKDIWTIAKSVTGTDLKEPL